MATAARGSSPPINERAPSRGRPGREGLREPHLFWGEAGAARERVARGARAQTRWTRGARSRSRAVARLDKEQRGRAVAQAAGLVREQAQAQHAPGARRRYRDFGVEELAARLELLGARGDARAKRRLDVGERLAALRDDVRERVRVADLGGGEKGGVGFSTATQTRADAAARASPTSALMPLSGSCTYTSTCRAVLRTRTWAIASASDDAGVKSSSSFASLPPAR